MNSRLIFFLLIGVLTLAGFSCTSATVKKENSLQKAAKYYNETMRWKRFGEASKFVKDEQKDQFLEKVGHEVDLMNITNVDVISTSLDKEDENKGTSRVWVTYYRLPSVNMKKELWVQNWNYDEESTWWTIDLPELEKPAKTTKSKEP